MHVDLPLPRALALLWLALPGVALAGVELAARLTSRRLLREALVPVLALALWLLAVHTAGLAARGFVAGLVLGTLGVAAGGVVARRSRGALPAVGRGLGLPALILIAVSTIPVAHIAFGWAFHDEDLYTGHMSVTSEIARGIYPPRHLTFADLPLRYHFGFNLVAAAVVAIGRARVDTAIDVTTVLLWPCAGCLLWALGRVWLGRGWPALVLVLGAGGLPWCAFAPPFRAGADRLSFCQVGGGGTVAPLVSTFFQHPWALGIPLALAVLLVTSSPDLTRRGPRLVVVAILLGALSLAHVVLFVTVLPSVVAAELWRARRGRLGRVGDALGMVAAALAAWIAAVAMGASVWSFGGSGAAAQALEIRPGIVPGWPDVARWHAQGYGVALGLALVGLPLLPRRGRLTTALLLGGSLGALNTLRYVHSGDIIKLGSVASIAMGLAAAAAVSRLLDAARGRGLGRGGAIVALATALALAASSGGLSFALFFFTPAVERFYVHALPPMARDDERAASFLRTRVEAGEIVFRREGPAAGYAQWGGLAVPWSDWGTATFGFPRQRLDARAALLRTLPADPGAYRAQGIVWLVLDPADSRLDARADVWIVKGEADVVATFGRLRVIKLRGPPR